MSMQMTASAKPAVYLKDESNQSCVFKITNTGDCPISFKGVGKCKMKETNDGIDICFSYGDGDEALCNASDAEKVKFVPQTSEWRTDFIFNDSENSRIIWRVSALNDTTLNQDDSLSVELNSVKGNGNTGTVTIEFAVHTVSAASNFSTDLKKIPSPEIINLWTSACENTRTFLSADVLTSQESEAFQQMPYVFPPPTPHPVPPVPPTPPTVRYQVNWITDNAASCELSYDNQTYDVTPGSGNRIIDKVEKKTDITLTAYGEEKVGKATKTIPYPDA